MHVKSPSGHAVQGWADRQPPQHQAQAGNGVMTDGWWDSLAVLPAGLVAASGSVLQMRAADIGDNDRLGVNRVLGAVVAALTTGQPACQFVPNWKELGRRTNYDRVALPSEHRDRYLVVQGSYMIRCSQPR